MIPIKLAFALVTAYVLILIIGCIISIVKKHPFGEYKTSVKDIPVEHGTHIETRSIGKMFDNRLTNIFRPYHGLFGDE